MDSKSQKVIAMKVAQAIQTMLQQKAGAMCLRNCQLEAENLVLKQEIAKLYEADKAERKKGKPDDERKE